MDEIKRFAENRLQDFKKMLFFVFDGKFILQFFENVFRTLFWVGEFRNNVILRRFNGFTN